MFTGIAWQDYITAVAITVIIYYIAVGLKYYTPELKELLSGTRSFSFIRRPPGKELSIIDSGQRSASSDNEDDLFNQVDDDFQRVEALVSHVKESIEVAARRKTVIAELKQVFRRILAEYPEVSSSAYREAVNELIVSECEKSGYEGQLTEETINGLWPV